METKFSTGTWHSHDGQIYPEQTGQTICLIPYYDNGNEEQQANAKLIAVAPQLLDACIDTLRILNLNPTNDNLYQRNKLTSLINQATN